MDLWKHQQEAVEFLDDQAVNRKSRGGLLAMEMGLGKSFTALYYLQTRTEADFGRFLIIAPQTVCASVWGEQIAKHWDTDIRPKPEIVNLYSGPQKKRVETLKMTMMRNPKQDVVFLVNYDVLIGGALSKALSEYQFDGLILDESHRIKSPDGKISKSVRYICDGGYSKIPPKIVLLLTGTPMPHSFLDMWSQVSALNPYVFNKKFYIFKNRYAQMGGFKNKQVQGIKPELEQEFTEFCAFVTYRVAAKDAIDLPEIMFQDRYIQLQPVIMRQHEEMYHFLYTEIEREDGEVEEVVADNALVKLLRMQQMTAGLMNPELVNLKMALLSDIVQDSGESHVVTFYRFVDEGENIEATMKRDGIKIFHVRGGQSADERAKSINDWRRQGGVIAVQIQAGGVGIDLTAARLGIYVSLGYSLGDYLQSVARLHRPGQTRNVSILHLIGLNSIDESVVTALRNKEDVVGHIIKEIKRARKQ